MVIIIPTSQKLLKQAQRLKEFHEQHDGLRVTIVPADELYNEFSSGTPDANAYRRYLRMLSDRAQSEADMPKYPCSSDMRIKQLREEGAKEDIDLVPALKQYYAGSACSAREPDCILTVSCKM